MEVLPGNCMSSTCLFKVLPALAKNPGSGNAGYAPESKATGMHILYVLIPHVHKVQVDVATLKSRCCAAIGMNPMLLFAAMLRTY